MKTKYLIKNLSGMGGKYLSRLPHTGAMLAGGLTGVSMSLRYVESLKTDDHHKMIMGSIITPICIYGMGITGWMCPGMGITLSVGYGLLMTQCYKMDLNYDNRSISEPSKI